VALGIGLREWVPRLAWGGGVASAIGFTGAGFACLAIVCDCMLDSLCLDRKCITFLYEELETGTSKFASSKSYTISWKCNRRAFWYESFHFNDNDLHTELTQ
jgi:hypothetical protein